MGAITAKAADALLSCPAQRSPWPWHAVGENAPVTIPQSFIQELIDRTDIVELVGRYGVLEIDDAAFPLFADSAVSARKATAWTLGVNWYLTSNLKLVVNGMDTQFEEGAVAGTDREDEKAVFSRLQVAF